ISGFPILTWPWKKLAQPAARCSTARMKYPAANLPFRESIPKGPYSPWSGPEIRNRTAIHGSDTMSHPNDAISNPKKVATCLWFDGVAEEAAAFYTSLIPDSGIISRFRPDPEGPPLLVEFTLAGVPYQALN